MTRWIVAGAVIVFALFWASDQIIRTQRVFQAEARLDAPLESPRREHPFKPETTRQARRLAVVLEEIRFPPEYKRIDSLMKEWIPRDPWNSLLWITHARAQIFLGREVAAEASLQRSAKLNPQFPRQRLESIQLLALLGHEKQALDVAQSIGRFGGSYRREAAEALLLTGILTPAEVFLQLEGDKAEPGEMAQLLETLDTNDRKSLAALFRSVPARAIENPEFQKAVARMFTSPAIPEAAYSLWRGEPVSGDALYIENPALAAPPFKRDFYLGWQKPPFGSRVEAAWMAPGQDGEQGHMRITIEPARGGKEDWQWISYRFVLPAVQREARIRLLVDPVDFPSGRVWMSARVPGHSGWHSEPLPARMQTQYLVVTVPPLDIARTIELRLHGDGKRNRFVFEIGELEVLLPDGEESRSETIPE